MKINLSPFIIELFFFLCPIILENIDVEEVIDYLKAHIFVMLLN